MIISFNALPIISCFALCSVLAFGQPKQLAVIGQTPGGGDYHVNWDSAGRRLIVGCGTSIWLYDCRDMHHIEVTAKQPLPGIINETDRYRDTLFVMATHDGVYGLDLSTKQLNVRLRLMRKIEWLPVCISIG